MESFSVPVKCAFVAFASGYTSMWQPASEQYFVCHTTPLLLCTSQ